MSVELFRDLGLDVETAIALEQELARLPARTRKVFVLRAQGYTCREVGVAIGMSRMEAVRAADRCEQIYALVCDNRPKNRAYIGEGEVLSDYT